MCSVVYVIRLNALPAPPLLITMRGAGRGGSRQAAAEGDAGVAPLSVLLNSPWRSSKHAQCPTHLAIMNELIIIIIIIKIQSGGDIIKSITSQL